MVEEKRSFFAIIPANVRYDQELSANAKLLYGEITALCNEKGYCWASNDYFARLYGVSKITISRLVKQLKKRGYISIQIQYKESTKEIEKRLIFISDPINKNDNRYIQNCYDPINKNVNTPINKNVKDNNTYINNTINNTNDNILSSTQKIVDEVIEYLNQKTNRNYNSKAKCNIDSIKARINEGATIDDFKIVIDKKVNEWLNNPKMNEYLRPTTLFSNKFDGYLNQKAKQVTTKDIAKYINFERFEQ